MEMVIPDEMQFFTFAQLAYQQGNGIFYFSMKRSISWLERAWMISFFKKKKESSTRISARWTFFHERAKFHFPHVPVMKPVFDVVVDPDGIAFPHSHLVHFPFTWGGRDESSGQEREVLV